MISLEKARLQLVNTGKWLYQKQMIAGTDGNMSVRLESGRVLITPSGVNKGRLSPDCLLEVDMRGQVLAGCGAPSTETAMHLSVYRGRSDISAVVHAHPPCATAFAVTGIDLADNILPEVVLFVGSIPLCKYAPTGTEAVPKAISPYLASSNAILLQNHGLLTFGRSLEEALHRHELVEHYARILLYARTIGEPRELPAEEVARLAKLRLQLDKDSGSKQGIRHNQAASR